MPPDASQPVLLYDGECGLCHRVVHFLLRRDRRARLKFAPLQSEPAQSYLRDRGLPTSDFDSLVFVPDWNEPARAAPLFRTAGALAAVHELGGAWRFAAWLRVVPPLLRDALYRLVARFRYRLFGPYRPAPLPRAEWEQRFLAR